MSAQLVVSLIDGVSGPAVKARTSLTALQRAERDVYLAKSGARLSRTQVAEERLLAAQEREREKRLARISTYGKIGGAAIAAGGYSAIRAWRSYAELERTIGRIVINADKPAEAIKPTIAVLQQAADAAKMPLDDMVAGLETLIASGRSLEESLLFLPTVARTAQASGAAISDIALTADSVAGSLGVASDKMQAAFDVLAAAGKAGKFELNDMARELPALLPAFAALGYSGEAGLKKIAAMLQIVRNQTGSSAEAATNLGNVFQKVYSRETANAFKKMGVDLPAALDKARKEGRDVIEELVTMTDKALKGDLSKLPLLFTDAQVQKGMRALLTQQKELVAQTEALTRASGTVARDFKQITSDSEGSWQALANNVQKVATSLGNLTGQALNPALDVMTDKLARMEAFSEGRRKMAASGRDEGEYRSEFRRRRSELYPDENFVTAWTEGNKAFVAAVEALGRGEISNIFDPLVRAARGQKLARDYAAGGGYLPARGGGRGLPEAMPAPTGRPKRRDEISATERMHHGYRQAGERSYGKGAREEDALAKRVEANIPAPRDFTVEAAAAQQQLESGVSSGGAAAASEIRTAIADGARALANTIRSALAGTMLNVQGGGAPARTVGQQVRTASEGQAVDFGGRR